MTDLHDPADRPEPDPLLAEILSVAAGIRPEDVEPDLDDPALRQLVDRAVTPFEPVLTPEGVEEARRMATFTLGTHPDIETVLERVRRRPGQQASGVRPTRSVAQLEVVARRRQRLGGA